MESNCFSTKSSSSLLSVPSSVSWPVCPSQQPSCPERSLYFIFFASVLTFKVPKPKPLTRWEKFAKAKGIKNKKRDRMVFDEESGEYRPRYGYKGINQVDKDWLMEVPDHIDPETDMFSKARADKKERVEKNEAQRVRNLKEQSGAAAAEKKASTVTTPKEHAAKLREERSARKVSLEKTAVLAQVSTASMGKFDKKIVGEAKPKGVKRKVCRSIFVSKHPSLKSLLRLISALKRMPILRF